jgi:prevent-host-death family protein
MAISGYHIAMSTVRIAELKNRLSEHLREVRAGRSLTILDRDTPIARIVPWESPATPLATRPRDPRAPKLQQVRLPPPLRTRIDVAKLLMEERQADR